MFSGIIISAIVCLVVTLLVGTVPLLLGCSPLVGTAVTTVENLAGDLWTTFEQLVPVPFFIYAGTSTT